INEFTSPGARFAVGMADDADVGSNSLQGYELETNEYFAVEVKDSQDGSKFAELVLHHSLDRESEQSLRLVLTALDGGDPSRTGTAQLWINVTDANDNPPVFAQDRYRARLREDTPPGVTVLNVSASDADAGTNAHITYSFGETPSEVLQKFILEAESGKITLKEPLDFEDTRSYTLLIEARDGGGLVAHCKVEVEVVDVNDNAPEITILKAKAIDHRYTGPHGTTVSSRGPSRGRGSARCLQCRQEAAGAAVDREEREEARSAAAPPAADGIARLLAAWFGANDNAPVFSQAEYTVRVPEDVPVGSVLVTVTATDADEGQYGEIKYS
ncbi:PCDGH protein, partial [Lanius ludovicianus]|nr:PCDGH protein [Lanius ludovicianus]